MTASGRDLDAELSAIAARDRSAFGRWMAGAERPLRDALRSFAANVDVEAILQDALLRAWQLAPRVVRDGKPNSLLRLALRVARTLALMELRRARVAPQEGAALEATLDVVPGPARTDGDPLLRKLIAECRDALPDKPALALALGARLASAGAEADSAIAARLGMRTNTFLQNFGRARKLLADCLRARGVDLDTEIAR